MLGWRWILLEVPKEQMVVSIGGQQSSLTKDTQEPGSSIKPCGKLYSELIQQGGLLKDQMEVLNWVTTE